MAPSDPSGETTPPATTRDTWSNAAFVVGLVAALTGVVYFVSVPVGLVGLALGVFAIRRPGGIRRVVLGGILLSTIGLLVGLGVVAFLVLDDERGDRTTTVDGIDSGTGDTEHPPQHDLVSPIECLDELGALRAAGRVANPTDRPVDYQLIATWERDGKTLAQSTALVEDVPAGGTAAWEVTAPGDDERGVTTCRVVRIDRSPS